MVAVPFAVQMMIMVASMAASFLLRKKPKAARFNRKLHETGKLVGKPLPVVYGRAHLTGNTVYRNIAGDKSSVEEAVALCWGPVTIHTDTIRINEKRPHYINGGENPNKDAAPGFLKDVRVTTHDGSLSQAIQPTSFVIVNGSYHIHFPYYNPSYNLAPSLSINGITFTSTTFSWNEPGGSIYDEFALITNRENESVNRANTAAQSIYDQIVAHPDYATFPYTASIGTEVVGNPNYSPDFEVGVVGGQPWYFYHSNLTIKTIRLSMKVYGDTIPVSGSNMVVVTTRPSGGGNGSGNPIDYGFNRTAYIFVSGKANDDFSGIDSLDVEVTRENLFVAGSGYNTPIPAELSEIHSSNVYAAALDYLLNTDYGPAIAVDRFDDFASWLACMAVCDVQVPNGEATTENRWEANLVVGDTEGDEHLDVLDDILRCAAGDIYESDGVIKAWVPTIQASVMTLDRSNFEPRAVVYKDILETPNLIEIEYLQEGDAEKRTVTFENATLIDEWGEIRERIPVHGHRSRTMASRMANLQGRKAILENRRLAGVVDQGGLKLEPGDMVSVTIGDADVTWVTAKKMIVESVVADNENGDVEVGMLEYPGDEVFDDSSASLIDNSNPLVSTDDSNSLPSANQIPLSPESGYGYPMIVDHDTGKIGITIGWDTVDQAQFMHQNFIIYRKRSTVGEWEVAGMVSGGTRTWIDQNVDINSYEYRYAVVSRTISGVEGELQDPYLVVVPVASVVEGTGEITPSLTYSIHENRIEYGFSLTWDPFGDLLRRRGYKVYYKKSSDPTYIPASELVLETFFTIPDVLPGTYDFKVVAVQLDAQEVSNLVYSDFSFTSAPYSVPSVTGLESQGYANETIFIGRDVHLVWRRNSPEVANQYALGEEPNGFGSGFDDPYFDSYRVDVIDPSTGVVLRSENVTDPFYTYTFQKNREDGGARRELTFAVYYRDTYGRTSEPETITLANEAPAIPASLTIEIGSLAEAIVSYDTTAIDDIDAEGIVIFKGAATDFTPSAANRVYRGNSNRVSIPLLNAATVYFRAAVYDAFGDDQLNYSDEVTIAPATVADIDGEPDAPTWPATPLTSSAVHSPDGTLTSHIQATWNANSEGDLSHYDWSYKKTSSSSWTAADTTERVVTFIATPGVQYDVRVRAIDIWSNKSPYSTTEQLTAASDTTPPGVVTGVLIAGQIGQIALQWTNPTDVDFEQVEIWVAASNDRAGATLAAKVKASAYIHAGQAPGVTRFYWLRAVDKSGNAGDWHAADNDGATATTQYVVNTDILDGTIEQTKFASGINVPGVGALLPADDDVGNFEGRLFVLTSDHKIYRFNGTTWTVTVDGGDIAASTILAAAIAAGAIGADQIAAGAVTTGKLSIGNFANLTGNPRFSLDGINPSEVEWGTNSDFDIVTNQGASVVLSSTIGVPSGAPTKFVLKVPGLSTNHHVMSRNIPVKPGERYRFVITAAAEKDGVQTNLGNLICPSFFTDKDDLSTGVSGGSWQSVEPGTTGISQVPETTWATYSATVLVPAGAAFMRSAWYVEGKGAPASDDNWYFTDIQIFPITPGVQIEDGAIVADKIQANAVITDKIIANGVTESVAITLDQPAEEVAYSMGSGPGMYTGTVTPFLDLCSISMEADGSEVIVIVTHEMIIATPGPTSAMTGTIIARINGVDVWAVSVVSSTTEAVSNSETRTLMHITTLPDTGGAYEIKLQGYSTKSVNNDSVIFQNWHRPTGMLCLKTKR